ncbi:hypothetical protein ACXIT0_11990 [Methylorubrum extorquens]
MNVKFCSSGVEEVLANYSECRDILLEALAHGDGRVNEALLVAQLVRGNYQLWRTENSAGVTQINENPFNKCLFIFLAGGDLSEIEHIAGPVIEQWAADQGCTSIILSGRRGWERALRPLGYEFQSTNLIKRIAG